MNLHRAEQTISNSLAQEKRRFAQVLLVATLLASPLVITSVLVYAYFRATIFDFVPDTSANDEVYYWHQAFTFSKVGFAGGYYTYEELPPRSANWVRFAAWGPAYPMLYGSIGFLLGGWKPYSPVLINVVLMTLAIAIFIFLIRPGVTQLIVLELLLVTWWPLWLYLPAATATSLNLAIAVVMAGVFHKLIRDREKFTGLSRYISLGLLLFASLEIPYWSLAAFPFFMLGTDLSKKKNIVFALSKAFLLIIVALVFELYSYSPLPYGANAIDNVIAGLKQSPLAGLQVPVSRIAWNTVGLQFHLSNPMGEYVWLRVLVVLQLLITLFIAALVGLYVFRQSRRSGLNSNSWLHRELVFHVFNLSGIWALATSFYFVAQVRHFMSFLLITFLLFIAFKHFRATTAIVLSNLLVMGLFLSSFSPWRSTAFEVKGKQGGDLIALDKYLVFQPEQDPWCNTMLSAAAPFSYAEVSATPPGIGYSAHFNTTIRILRLPIRSKYVLFNLGEQPTSEWGHLKLLASTTLGSLYVNLDADCPK